MISLLLYAGFFELEGLVSLSFSKFATFGLFLGAGQIMGLVRRELDLEVLRSEWMVLRKVSIN